MSTQNKRWERLKAASIKPTRTGKQLPLDFWTGRGYPLNPYFKSKIVAFLRFELRPKEIGLPPEWLCFEGEVEFNERTLIRNWISQ